MELTLPGWQFTIGPVGGYLYCEVRGPVVENARADGTFEGLRDGFLIHPEWSDEEIARRAFATVQYLTDHELREQFLVDGVRMFDPHEPVSVTGEQHDWFVEAEAAVRGY